MYIYDIKTQTELAYKNYTSLQYAMIKNAKRRDMPNVNLIIVSSLAKNNLVLQDFTNNVPNNKKQFVFYECTEIIDFKKFHNDAKLGLGEQKFYFLADLKTGVFVQEITGCDITTETGILKTYKTLKAKLAFNQQEALFSFTRKLGKNDKQLHRVTGTYSTRQIYGKKIFADFMTIWKQVQAKRK